MCAMKRDHVKITPPLSHILSCPLKLGNNAESTTKPANTLRQTTTTTATTMAAMAAMATTPGENSETRQREPWEVLTEYDNDEIEYIE